MYTRVCIQAGFMRQQELLKLLLENISSAQTTQVKLKPPNGFILSRHRAESIL